MLNTKQKILIGAAASTTTSLSFAFCFCWYSNESVTPFFVSATSSIVAAVTAVDASLSALSKVHNEYIMSAISILTKQKAISSNQVAQTTKESYQTTAAALNTLGQTQRATKARFDYGPEFGQGYNPCLVSATRSHISNDLLAEPAKIKQQIEQEVIAKPGNYVDKNKFIDETLVNYKKNYCSEEQKEAGLCEDKGKYPTKAVNIASIFAPAEMSSQEHKVKVDFINHLVGVPDGLPPTNANDATTRNYILQKQQKDANLSPALYSLKGIQNDYVEKVGKGSSIAGMLEKETNRYMGVGEDGKYWAKSLVSQNHRGLMLELLKVKALDLSIQARQYEQQERIETNLAILVANAANKLKNKAISSTNISNSQ